MMMLREQIFHAWAPSGAKWSAWVKPVLFAHLLVPEQTMQMPRQEPVVESDFSWMPTKNSAVAIVIDLPAEASLAMGLKFADKGFRPIPLFNACPAPRVISTTSAPVAALDLWPVMRALEESAAKLPALGLPDDAPPAFLLDSERREGGVTPLQPGMFDNRSVSLPTDFPSANLLLAAGIRRAVLVQKNQSQPQVDLAHALLRWQRAGIAIDSVMLDDSHAGAQPITVRRPLMFRLLWHRLFATMGLRRSPLGGFGGYLPIPSASG